jgi:hypothetical protein
MNSTTLGSVTIPTRWQRELFTSGLVQPCTEHVPKSFKSHHDFTNYLMCSLPHRMIDGLFTYVIPSQLPLFKINHTVGEFRFTEYSGVGSVTTLGSATIPTPKTTLGAVTLSEAVEVINLDSLSNLQILHAKAVAMKQHDVVEAIQRLFPVYRLGVSTDSLGVRLEHNQSDMDTLLAFICQLGFNGMAMKALLFTETPATLFLCPRALDLIR